jgi:uncharacterized membrane protein
LSERSHARSIRANLIAGVLTVIPLLVVWVVLDFIFSILFALGAPLEAALSRVIAERMPGATPWLENDALKWLVAVAVALLILYTIGAIASRVVGMRVIAAIEMAIARIPFVETIYSASKKLIGLVQQKPDDNARVVLLDFPQPGMKTVGLVTRLFKDPNSGEELAAVYVPTALNPTSGFLEILPARELISTALTMDQAITMIVSGGAVIPETFGIAPSSAAKR